MPHELPPAPPKKTHAGVKDLETFGGAVPPGDVLFALEVVTLGGQRCLVAGSALREAAARGGAGGVWQAVLRRQGLYDPADPWQHPPGDLTVTVRFPPLMLAERRVQTCLRPQPVALVGSAGDAVCGALAAGPVAAALCHRAEAEAMACDYPQPPRPLLAVCLAVAPPAGAGAAAPCSRAAAAAARTLARRVPGLQARCLRADCLLDEEWCWLHEADAIILDMGPSSPAGAAADELLRRCWPALEAAGILQCLLQRWWCGAHVIGIGQACALLGRPPSGSGSGSSRQGAVLPFYAVRAGGGADGWESLRAGMCGEPAGAVGVGVIQGSYCTVNHVSGAAEMVCAPTRDVLIATAQWSAAHEEPGSERGSGREADEDWGYFYAHCAL